MMKKTTAPIRILLADDDSDDRYFFEKALADLPFASSLAQVDDGEKLMSYLQENITSLPDVLFLDLNMPRKNGTECLLEIKSHLILKTLPVVIYSTSVHESVAEVLFKTGAHFYIRKTDYDLLVENLQKVLSGLMQTNFKRPLRADFIIR